MDKDGGKVLQGFQASGNSAVLGFGASGNSTVNGKETENNSRQETRESIGVTQYTDMTGLSQYTEESHCTGLSEYTCSDVTGLTQHTVNSDISHLTQYSDTTGFLPDTTNPDNLNSAVTHFKPLGQDTTNLDSVTSDFKPFGRDTTNLDCTMSDFKALGRDTTNLDCTAPDFKPLGRDSMDFEITASMSARLGLRDSSVSSDVSQTSSLYQSNVHDYHSVRSSRESLGSEISVLRSKKSEASVGKVIKEAGVVDYVLLEDRQRLLIGGDQNDVRAQVSHVTDMRHIQRPSLEGAADDNGKPELVADDRKLSTGSKVVSTAAPESERSSTDYNQLDLFAQVSDKQVNLAYFCTVYC